MVAARKTTKPGLYANIHAKQERIAHGSGERMRKPGSAGAPSEAAFEAAAGKKARKSAKRGPATGKTSAKASRKR
jgi:hypothetical protein